VSATRLFLAEKYVPAPMAADLAAVVDHDWGVARVASIRHVRTTYTPGQENLLFLGRDNDRFQLGYRRVTTVIEIQSAAPSATH
jgi:hypothetical protein